MRLRLLLIILVVGFCTSIIVLRRASAIDLGGGAAGGDKPVPVTIEKQPVDFRETSISEVRPIASEIQLNYGQDYESDWLDVRDYRAVAFYVIADKVLTEPRVAIRYQLDAFFTVDIGKMTVLGTGGEKQVVASFAQEFGAAVAKEEVRIAEPSFTKLTTGETSSRVLYTPVYGPFVRVTLKSLTEADRRRFRIVAYLAR